MLLQNLPEINLRANASPEDPEYLVALDSGHKHLRHAVQT
jgi:hypothetical protein